MPRYVALTPISHGGALAYQPGDPVHEDNVARNGYEVGVQVAEVDSGEGRQLLASLSGPTIEQPPEAARQLAGDIADVLTRPVADVNAWLGDHPDAAAELLAAEQAGRRRAGILHGPHGVPPDVAEA